MPYTPFSNADQGLATLGKALFPDPATIAQTGYYGAAQREKMLSGNKIIDQQNAANQVLALTPGSGINYTTPTFSVPPNSPAGAPPVMNSPAGLPVVPPAGGAPSLSGTVTTPAPGPVPGPPTPPGGTLDAGAAAQSATKIADTVIGNANGADPPLPGMHPGTFQAPGGGIKQAPPAAHDGSPAPLVDPSLFVNMAVRAGYDASQVQVMGNAYVMQKMRNGELDQKTGEDWMAGFGQAALVQARTSLATTRMNNETELAKQRMVTGEQGREFDLGDILTTEGPGGQPIHTPRKDSFGKPAYDASYSTQYNTPALTQPTPGGPPVAAKQGEVKPGTPMFNQPYTADYNKPTEVSGPNGEKLTQRAGELPPGPTAAYSPEREKAGMTPVLVMDPANHNQLKTVSTLEFNKGGYVRAPANIPVAEAGTLQDRLDQRVARRFPPPPVSVKDAAWLSPARADGEDNARLLSTMTELYQSSPDPTVRGNYDNAADAAITKAQQEGWLPSTEEAAAQRAHLIGTGALSKDHVFQTQDPQGKTTNTFYLLPKPTLGKTVAPGTSAPAVPAAPAAPVAAAPAPATPAASPGTSIMSAPTLGDFVHRLFGGGGTPAATAPAPAPAATAPRTGGAMPSGAIMAVPDGQENQTGTTRDGTRFVVHGGFAFPVAPLATQGR